MSENNYFTNKFSQGNKEEQVLKGKCNILIIGKSGVGKSTLINTLFGEQLAQAGAGKPVTQKIESYNTQNSPVTIYDSPGLELANTNQFCWFFFDHNSKMRAEVSHLIDSQKKLASKEHIHIIWYCINNESDRIEETEEIWIKELSDKIPVIIVLTKAFTQTNEDFMNKLKRLPVSSIIPVLAQGKNCHKNLKLESHGLENLVSQTSNLLPVIAQVAFNNALKNIAFTSHSAKFWLVHAYFPSTFLVPVLLHLPIASKLNTASAQMIMFKHISTLFDIQFNNKLIFELFVVAQGFQTGTEEALNNASTYEVLQKALDNIAQWIHCFVTEIPVHIPIVGGVITGSSAAFYTLVVGLAYTDLLEQIKTAELEGRDFANLNDLGTILRENIQKYASLGWEVFNLFSPKQAGTMGA